MTKALFNAFLVAALLAGCAWQMSLMPRDSGKVYSGSVSGNGMGSGTATVTIEGVTFTGPAVRTASNDSFGFANTYGSNSRGTFARSTSTMFIEGDKYVKAMLSSSDGKGLRCDLVGRAHGGGGICVDDTGRVYDVVFVAR